MSNTKGSLFPRYVESSQSERNSDRRVSIASSRSLAPYLELGQWDRPYEPPLIQLDPSATPDFAGNGVAPTSNLNFWPTLLDLDEPIDLPIQYPREREIRFNRRPSQHPADLPNPERSASSLSVP